MIISSILWKSVVARVLTCFTFIGRLSSHFVILHICSLWSLWLDGCNLYLTCTWKLYHTKKQVKTKQDSLFPWVYFTVLTNSTHFVQRDEQQLCFSIALFLTPKNLNTSPKTCVVSALREKRSTVVAQLKQLQSETEPIVKMFEDPETTRQMQSTRFDLTKKYSDTKTL